MNAAEEIDMTIEGVLADGTPVKAKCRYRAKDISVELLSPYPEQHAGRHIMFMSPRTYTANEYWGKAAWELIEDLACCGLGLPEDKPTTIDVAAFSAYLKRHDCGKIDFVLDAWREIAREDDSWCATLT